MMYSVFMTTLIVALIIGFVYLLGVCIMQANYINDLEDEIEELRNEIKMIKHGDKEESE